MCYNDSTISYAGWLISAFIAYQLFKTAWRFRFHWKVKQRREWLTLSLIFAPFALIAACFCFISEIVDLKDEKSDQIISKKFRKNENGNNV